MLIIILKNSKKFEILNVYQKLLFHFNDNDNDNMQKFIKMIKASEFS